MNFIIPIICIIISFLEATISKDLPKLLIVSYDGFGPMYLNRGITPNLNNFKEKGTYAPFLKNVFPTKTFPNHQSISTGLYPEEHGVTGSEIYDSELGKLTYGPQMYEYNDEITPIWTWNELNGGKSGCMMWPGTDFSYSSQRINCSFYEKLNVTHPNVWEDRLEKVLQWYQEGANLVMLYIEEPDHHGHIYGVGDTQNEVRIKNY